MQFSTKARRVQRPSAPQAESGDEKQPTTIIAARHEFANSFGDAARGETNWQFIAFGVTGVLATVAIANLGLGAEASEAPQGGRFARQLPGKNR